MATFSFDIVSTYDKAEINNVFSQIQRDITNRYDLKGTPAAVEWLDDKAGFKVTAANEMHLESIQDIIRRAIISRNQSTKILDLQKDPIPGSMKLTKEIPFIDGLDCADPRAISESKITDSGPRSPCTEWQKRRITSSHAGS